MTKEEILKSKKDIIITDEMKVDVHHRESENAYLFSFF